jgi:hypothetical protein
MAAKGIAAKNQKTARRGATEREPDIQDLFALHVSASQRRDALLEEVRALQAAGKIREARKRLETAREIQHRLTALETEVRLGSRCPASSCSNDAR